MPAAAARFGKAMYSQAALDDFCSGAQSIVANTSLVSENVISRDLGTAGSPFPPPGTPTQDVEAGYMANAWIRMRHTDYDELRRMLNMVGETIKVLAK